MIFRSVQHAAPVTYSYLHLDNNVVNADNVQQLLRHDVKVIADFINIQPRTDRASERWIGNSPLI